MKHLIQFIIFFFFFTGTVVLTNFFIDPTYSYFKRFYTLRVVHIYIEKLQTTSHGLPRIGNPRDFRYFLASKIKNKDCYIIASSRAFWLTPTLVPNFQNICPTSLNLSVPGSGWDDFLLYSYLFAKSNAKTLLLEIPHHFFSIKQNASWEEGALIKGQSYTYHLNKSLEYFGFSSIDSKSKITSALKWLKPLLSLELLTQSFHILKNKSLSLSIKPPLEAFLQPVTPFDWKSPPPIGVILPDGAVLWPKRVISEKKENEMSENKHLKKQLRHEMSLIESWENIKQRLEKISQVISVLKSKEKNIIFYTPPFNTKILDQKNDQDILQYLSTANDYASLFANQKNVEKYGNFLLEETNCPDYSHYDFFHPTPSCINSVFE